jgi:hypothetical protein
MEPTEQPVEPAEAQTQTETEVTTEVQPDGEGAVENQDKPEETLYELPDGRKVDGKTLTKEWKDNFLPEFTRKSQRLKEIETAPKGDTNKPDKQQGNPWEDPNWQPKDWSEVFAAADRRSEALKQSQKAAEEAAKGEVEKWVDVQLAEIRKSEPDLNEDLLFAHASKYGFADLKGAYRNMKDLNLAVKSTEKKVVQNMKARAAAASPTGDGTAAGDGMTYEEFQHSVNESPLDALRRLKK